MKVANILSAVLLIVGGLNWGLYGAFGLDLVANLFGHFSIVSRIVYVLVGVAAIYQVVGRKQVHGRA